MPATRTQDSTARVSTLELFFDLVFVFTVTQVTSIVEHAPSWSTVGQALLELLVIYWMYGGFAWFTNTLGASSPRQRTVLLLGLAAFLVVSLSVPRAFGTDAVAFGWAYLLLTVVHLCGFLFGGERALARAILPVAGPNLVAAALIVIAGYAGAPWHWALWGGAVAVQWLPPLLGGSSGGFPIDPGHFGERHGLMVLIVLGESLVSVALAAQDVDVTVGLALGVLCGLACTTAMWWCYFAQDDERAATAFGASAGRIGALVAYDVPHLPMMAGVLGVAAGARLALPDLTAPASTVAATLLGGGVALYLAGLSLFRAGLGFAPAGPRLVTAVAVLGLIPVGRYLGAAQQFAASAAVVTVMLLIERRSEPGERPAAAT